MVHLERNSADDVLAPKFISVSEVRIQVDDAKACADDPDLAKIARRFAPGPEAAGPARDNRLRRQAEQTLSKVFSPGLRALFAAVIILTASPPPAVEGFNWLTLVEAPRSELGAAHPDGGISQSAVAAGVVPVTLAAPLPPASLTTPEILEGEAGKEIDFAIALLGAPTLPARSIVAIGGLPSNSMLSSGRPYGSDEWNLRLDEIAGLRLALPATASGESKLTVHLLTLDGESIASAETVLRVASASHPASASAPGFAFVPVSTGLEQIPNEVQVERPWFEEVQRSDSGDAPASGDVAAVHAVEVHEDQAQSPPAALAPSEGQSSSWVEFSDFVNLREGPASSARVIGRLAKGSKARVLGRKHGWLQVAGSGTSATGWVYSRYALATTEAQPTRRKLLAAKAEPSRVGPKSEEGFWTRVGRWFTGN